MSIVKKMFEQPAESAVADSTALEAIGVQKVDGALFFERQIVSQYEKSSIATNTRKQVKEALKPNVLPNLTKEEWQDFLYALDIARDQAMSSWKFDEDNNVTITQYNRSFVRNTKLNYLPKGLSTVIGGISFQASHLCTLENFPHVQGGIDLCNCFRLTSLVGMQKKLCGDLSLGYCKALTSLEGISKRIEGHCHLFGCSSLQSLDFLPEYIQGDLHLYGSNDFDEFSATTTIGGAVHITSDQVKLKAIFDERKIRYMIIIP